MPAVVGLWLMTEIRTATVDDAAALAGAYLDSAQHHVAVDPALYRLPQRHDVVRDYEGSLAREPGDWTILVADVAGQIVGMAEVRLAPTPSPGSMLRPARVAMVDIAVAADHRGGGIGTALMAAAETWAVERGFRALLLDMHARNTPARAFYLARGYAQVGSVLRKPLRDPG